MFFILKELILFVAEVFYILKFYDKSSNLYCLVYKNGENELECLERMVSCYGHLEKIDLVLKYCNKYLEIDENNFNILYFKGQALFYKNYYVESLKNFDLALELSPDNLNCLLSKASVLLVLNEDDLFLKCSDHILDLDSNNSQIFYYKSYFYFKKEDFDLALKFIEKSLKNESNNKKALSLKSMILDKLN